MCQEFYDRLAPYYHLIYPDWESSVQRQSSELNALILREWGTNARSILDVSCGIGTQSLGLAKLGFDVTASDVSQKAVQRARTEAWAKGLRITFKVADMRRANETHAGPFDVLISCDNAVPHLLSDDDIAAAFRSFYECIRPGGGCLISVRDYSEARTSGTEIIPHGVRSQPDRTFVVFQVRQHSGEFYDLAMYIVEDDGGETGVSHIFRTRYYAIPPDRLAALMKAAGFQNVRWATRAFYQPVLLGSK